MREYPCKSRRAGSFYLPGRMFLVLVIQMWCCVPCEALFVAAPAKTALHVGDHGVTSGRRSLGISRNGGKMKPGSVCAAAASGEGAAETDLDNLQWLSKRFNFPDEWASRDTRNAQQVKKMDPITLETKLEAFKKRLDLTEDELGVIVRRDVASIAFYSMSQNIEPTLHFLSKELSLSDDQLATVVKRQPRVLTGGIREGQSLQRNIQWFKDRFGQDDDGKLVNTIFQKAPTLLMLSVDDNLAPTMDKLQERLHLKDREVARLVAGYPTMLACNYKGYLEPKLNWLQEFFGWNDHILSKTVQKSPSLLVSSLDTLKAKTEWLKDRLEWSDAQLTRAVTKQPIILALNSDSIEEKCVWLQQQLDWDRQKMSRSLCSQPQLLHIKTDKMEGTFVWLMERLESDQSTTAQIFKKIPPLFAYATETLEQRLQWLERELVLDNVEELTQFVRRMPSALPLSIPGNLEPTLKFYKDCFGNDDVTIDAIKKSPTLLCRSLTKRLEPRRSQASGAGIDTTSGTNIRKIALLTNEQWTGFMEKSTGV